MTPFTITAPGRILFGRGEAAKALAILRGFGSRGVIVHGANAARAAWLVEAPGPEVLALSCAGEPTLDDLLVALQTVKGFRPDWVAALGGGAVLDLGKALAALIPAPDEPMQHLEVVGKGLPLVAAPLPFIAIATTAGTGAGLAALMRLTEGEDAGARDRLAWVSLCGGLALSNGGLGAVHGLAEVIGGMMTGAAHGAICGALLGPVLTANLAAADGEAQRRPGEICGVLGGVLGCAAEVAPQALQDWARAAGLPGLGDLGVKAHMHAEIVSASLSASLMTGNPVPLDPGALHRVLERA